DLPVALKASPMAARSTAPGPVKSQDDRWESAPAGRVSMASPATNTAAAPPAGLTLNTLAATPAGLTLNTLAATPVGMTLSTLAATPVGLMQAKADAAPVNTLLPALTSDPVHATSAGPSASSAGRPSDQPSGAPAQKTPAGLSISFTPPGGAASTLPPIAEGPRIDASWQGNTPPPYPVTARRQGLQGTVRLDLLIEADGSVAEIRMRESSGSAVLDRSVMTAVRQWRFIPARQQGQSVAAWYSDWEWVFRLQEGS
ncbi:MAG: TonB family protein, partial [Burkholderiales bacterium]